MGHGAHDTPWGQQQHRNSERPTRGKVIKKEPPPIHFQRLNLHRLNLCRPLLLQTLVKILIVLRKSAKGSLTLHCTG